MNHPHQDNQTKHLYAQSAQPRNKFHGQPLLFHHNPCHSKQHQSDNSIMVSKLSNVTHGQPQQQFVPDFQSRGISHERPQILSKQPRLSPSILDKTTNNQNQMHNFSVNSLPPFTSFPSSYSSTSEQSDNTTLFPHSFGLTVSEKNNQQDKCSFHINTTSFERAGMPSIHLQPALSPQNEILNQLTTSYNTNQRHQLQESEARRNLNPHNYQNSQPNIIQTLEDNVATKKDKRNDSATNHKRLAILNNILCEKGMTFESIYSEDQYPQKPLQELSLPHQISYGSYICNDCDFQQEPQACIHSWNNAQIHNNSQAAVDQYSLQAEETIPQIVVAIQSMALKSKDIERFLDSQERHIEGGFAQLVSHLNQTKEALLNTISACRNDIRRRYKEINTRFQKSLKDLLNSQEDIQLNYEKIILEFEEQQVNFVIQAYNDQLQEAQSILLRSKGTELLEVLKFDASILSSLQDSIGLTALTSLKKIRTTFSKQNSSSSGCPSPYGSPIGSRSSSKTNQRVTQMPGFQYNQRNCNIEGSQRSLSKQFSLNKLLNSSTKNCNNNLFHCSHGNSMSNNNSYNNNSSKSHLESSNQQNQFDKQKNEINRNKGFNPQERQTVSQVEEKQSESVYVSFDNQEAFKITGDQFNKENIFKSANTNNLEQLNKNNQKLSYQKNLQQCIPTVKANFQIPYQQENNRDTKNLIKNEAQSFCNLKQNNDLLNQLQTAHLNQLNIATTEISSQRNSLRQSINNSQERIFLHQVHNEESIPKENSPNSTSTETARLQFEKQAKEIQKDISLTQKYGQVTSSSESCQQQQQQQANYESPPNSIQSSKELRPLSNISQQNSQLSKFNDILKVVQANQMQVNQNCQTILQQVSDSIRVGNSRNNSAQSSIQGRQAHNRSGSTQASSIAASTRFERSSSQHAKFLSKVPLNMFSLDELVHKPYVETVNPVLQDEQLKYQSPIEEESDKGSNMVGVTESSECKSISNQENHQEKPQQLYIPFMSPIDY